MSELDEYIGQSKDAIRALKDIKGSLNTDLENIQIIVDEQKSPTVAGAVTEVFGEMESDDPRKGFITFEMYMQCIRIINAAGQAKADSTLEGDFL